MSFVFGHKATDAFDPFSRTAKPHDLAGLYREDLGFEW